MFCLHLGHWMRTTNPATPVLWNPQMHLTARMIRSHSTEIDAGIHRPQAQSCSPVMVCKGGLAISASFFPSWGHRHSCMGPLHDKKQNFAKSTGHYRRYRQ